MPKIRYLKIRFANRLMPWELPLFRGAVIEATGRQSSLFHNHGPDDTFLYRYPKIQYKITERKATIICLDDGTDDIHYLLQNRSLDLRIGERQELFEIEDIHIQYPQLQTWQANFQYALKNWQGLNQENYQKYQALEGEVERLQFLEKMLLGNLLAIARDFDLDSEIPIQLQITRMKEEKWLGYKGRKVLCFTLNFKTNLSLPDYVGLGKGVSVGFGSVKRFGEVESRSENQANTSTEATMAKAKN
jgi:hypothetical protein